MEKLNKVITTYLSSEDTDYAIMINGEWGCGKTYYLEHHFKVVLDRITAPTSKFAKSAKKTKRIFGFWEKEQNQSRHFKPAFISLYGLSSADDFYQRVFYGINNWANNGVVRLLGVGFSKLTSIFNVETGKEDSKAITYVDTNRVLVFDDLERICDEKISIKEVLGLINTYSEHENHKVIIVCNENAFLGKEVPEKIKNSYIKYKEKSVRYTYTYVADVTNVYDYTAKKVKDRDYRQYLQNNRKSILDVFNIGGKGNLRTLISFIDAFQQIYDEIKDDPYATDVTHCFMVTTLVYSMEYKRGITIDQLREINPVNYQIDTSLFELQEDNDVNITKDYGTEFRELYSDKLPYFINNEVILDYIIDGYLYCEKLQEAVKELSSQYHRQRITPEGKVFRRLRNYATLEDDDVIPLIKDMMKYVDEDKYNIYDLLYIYADLLKCGHWKFSGFKITKKITKQIKDSIKRQSVNHIYNPSFEFKVPMWDRLNGETYEYKVYKEMKDFANKINYNAKLKKNNMDGKAFMYAAESGDLKKLATYRENGDKVISTSDLDWKSIFNLLYKGSNPLACELCNCIIFLTSMGNLQPDDINRIKREFKPLLDKYDAQKDKRVRAMFIDELKHHIEKLTK